MKKPLVLYFSVYGTAKATAEEIARQTGADILEIEPAVPYLFLFGDRDWLVADPEHGEMDFKVTAPIAAFLRNLIKLYGLEETPRTYTCGEISYYVYLNKNRVPMLTVGRVAGMTHANYPRESWIAYDEFLSKFSKTEDGKLLYMGKQV